MLCFRACDMRPVLEEARARKGMLCIVKNQGIYLMADGATCRSDGRALNLAYAAGCHPTLDADWADVARHEAGGDDFAEPLYLSDVAYQEVLERHYDIIVTVTPERFLVETMTAEMRYVCVEEYRNQTGRVFDQAKRHFCACKGNGEFASWRATAWRILDEVVSIDCKRAKPEDRDQRSRAITALKSRIGCVTPEGVVRYPASDPQRKVTQ